MMDPAAQGLIQQQMMLNMLRQMTPQGYPGMNPAAQGYPQQGMPQPGMSQPGMPQPGMPQPGANIVPADFNTPALTPEEQQKLEEEKKRQEEERKKQEEKEKAEAKEVSKAQQMMSGLHGLLAKVLPAEQQENPEAVVTALGTLLNQVPPDQLKQYLQPTNQSIPPSLPQDQAAGPQIPQYGDGQQFGSPTGIIPKDLQVCQKQCVILSSDREYVIMERTAPQNGTNYTVQNMWMLPRGEYMVFRVPSAEEEMRQMSMQAPAYSAPAMVPVQLPINLESEIIPQQVKQ